MPRHCACALKWKLISKFFTVAFSQHEHYNMVNLTLDLNPIQPRSSATEKVLQAEVNLFIAFSSQSCV